MKIIIEIEDSEDMMGCNIGCWPANPKNTYQPSSPACRLSREIGRFVATVAHKYGMKAFPSSLEHINKDLNIP